MQLSPVRELESAMATVGGPPVEESPVEKVGGGAPKEKELVEQRLDSILEGFRSGEMRARELIEVHHSVFPVSLVLQ